MPKLRPLRKVEDLKNIPPEEEVLIELAPEEDAQDADKDSGNEALETDEQKEAKRLAAKEYRQNKKEEEEALRAETTDLKRQLEEMRRAAEENKRSVLAAQQEAERIARERAEEVSRYASRAEDAEYDAVLTAISAAEGEAESGQRDLENALNNADNKAVVDAQRRIARAEARLVQLNDGKDALEHRRQAAAQKAKDEANRPPVRQNLTPEQQIDAVPNLGHAQKEWLKGHLDAWTDSRKNLRLQGAHVEAEDLGYAPGSKEYFTYLEERLGYKKPGTNMDDDEEEEDTAPRKRQFSAPPSRENISAKTGRPTSTQIKLTAEQRAAARMSGIDEVTYARNLQKLQQLKGEGYYNEG